MSATFLEAWRRRNEIDLERESVLPYLYGISLNVLRNHRRGSKRYRALQEKLASAGPVLVEVTDTVSDDLIERMDDVDRARELDKALNRLSERDRDIVTLCVVQELSYAEAAEALDIPIGTVRSRLARARQRLGRTSSARSIADLWEPETSTGHNMDEGANHGVTDIGTLELRSVLP